ncbi:hypothetical protein GF312_05400 [Candidatus Poribacteria bacterium]|nr:hypothetical protein [Candidatus Poribacteria bacterium]
MESLSKVKIGKHEITRLIVGGNPFSGNSHQTGEMSREMRDYYTTEKIKETLRECERYGINTIQARADNHIMRMLNEYWNEGGKLQWIAQTASERSSIPENIGQLASYGAIACYHHGSRTDALYREGKIDMVKDFLNVMKDHGLPAGLGTHNPEVVRYAEDNNFDADFYMLAFYNLSMRGEIYLPEDRQAACEVIREINKPFLAFKIMAAGRNEPIEAFKYTYENIKPTDAVVVGIYTKHHPNQVEEDVKLAKRYGSLT